MQTKTIKVTQTDIKNGISASRYKCPIALAIKRTYKISYVKVDALSIDTYQGWEPTPKQARNFIQKFDARLPVKPFSFKITI